MWKHYISSFNFFPLFPNCLNFQKLNCGKEITDRLKKDCEKKEADPNTDCLDPEINFNQMLSTRNQGNSKHKMQKYNCICMADNG